MTIDLRYLAFLLPFVLPPAFATTFVTTLSIAGVENTIPENIAKMSILLGVVVSLLAIFAAIESKPVLRKLW